MYGIPGFFLPNFSDTGKGHMPTRDFCAIQRKDFFVSGGGKDVPFTAGVIFSWLGNVKFLLKARASKITGIFQAGHRSAQQ